jgi:hypothetical protein
MMLMNAGARPQVWTTSIRCGRRTNRKARGCFGSDQGWISFCLGPNEPRWSKADGVYSFRNHLKAQSALPAGARIVFFHGNQDPWQSEVQHQYKWIGEHYTP